MYGLPVVVVYTVDLKLDADIMIEWQKHTQTMTDYKDLLNFIDVRAQAWRSPSFLILSRVNPLDDPRVPAEQSLPSRQT